MFHREPKRGCRGDQGRSPLRLQPAWPLQWRHSTALGLSPLSCETGPDGPLQPRRGTAPLEKAREPASWGGGCSCPHTPIPRATSCHPMHLRPGAKLQAGPVAGGSVCHKNCLVSNSHRRKPPGGCGALSLLSDEPRPSLSSLWLGQLLPSPAPALAPAPRAKSAAWGY